MSSVKSVAPMWGSSRVSLDAVFTRSRTNWPCGDTVRTSVRARLVSRRVCDLDPAARCDPGLGSDEVVLGATIAGIEWTRKRASTAFDDRVEFVAVRHALFVHPEGPPRLGRAIEIQLDQAEMGDAGPRAILRRGRGAQAFVRVVDALRDELRRLPGRDAGTAAPDQRGGELVRRRTYISCAAGWTSRVSMTWRAHAITAWHTVSVSAAPSS